MGGKVTLEDRAEVSDVLARYCFFVDEGESDAWTDLWTEDGVFAGVTPEPIRGREALKQVPVWSLSGGCRHKLVNPILEYGDTDDEMIVRCYNFVTAWLNDASINSLAVARYHLLRRGDTWKIRSNQVRMQTPAGSDTNNYPEGFPYPANQPTKFPPI
ncbi:nuclear transport factor 2 family protein [Phenylobacterium sp.]|jgi:3-phenylpropionate/cinnamic acid dioxygenase small subunit|uniref:nuclear transport factor 2 family protein n=1 Tax=Phenylobacterium sp. TaxID=1871053 RepID=UPI002F3F62C4